MKAVLYTWAGSPETGKAVAIGEVRLDPHSPAAVWDEGLDGYFNPLPNDPRTDPRVPVDPSRGVEFIQAMPYVFKSAPYCWAEVSGMTSTTSTRPSSVPAPKPKLRPRWRRPSAGSMSTPTTWPSPTSSIASRSCSPRRTLRRIRRPHRRILKFSYREELEAR